MATDRSDAIGTRLRTARDRTGLSLSEVARRAGVGKGTLSELENGHRPPRLETLWALSTALGIPLSALVGTADRPAGSAVRATLVDRWTSDAFYELYRGTVGTRRQRSPAHAQDVTEVQTVLSGTLRAGIAGRLQTATAGQSITFRADVPHTYQAVGGICEVLIVIRYSGGCAG